MLSTSFSCFLLSGRQITLNVHLECDIMRHIFILMHSVYSKEDLKGSRAPCVRGLRVKVRVWEERWSSVSGSSSLREFSRESKMKRKTESTGKGLEKDGKMNVGEEITTSETRRKNSGGVPQMSVSVKDVGVPVLIGYKGLCGNITHG